MIDRKIRLAVAGLGERGRSLLPMFCDLYDKCEIVAICDVYEDRLELSYNKINELSNQTPARYTDYRKMFAETNPDCVYICTSWETHVEIALSAMENGVYVGLECGGTTSLELCYDLLNAYKKTGTKVMFLENCCYGRFEMAALRLAKEGKFGTLIHAEGGYKHDLRDEVACGRENRHYRFNNYLNRNGELYPQHALGPIMKDLDINRGNRIVSLVSMASKACGLNEWCRDNKGPDYDGAAIKFSQGDVVTTMMKCANGETITLTHDTTLPRPYSRGGMLQGTKGMWMETAPGLSNGIVMEGITHDTHNFENFGVLLDDPKIEHPLWTEFRKNGIKGTHDGMDWLVFNAFLHCVKEEIEPPIDIYDATLLLSIVPLSEKSIALGSAPVEVPDFTDGKWMHREEAPKHKYSLDRIHYDIYDI